MIAVKEVFRLNDNATVLVCDMFSDEDVKNTLQSDWGTHKKFRVEKPKNCFSEAKTRDIVLFGKDDYSKITGIKFI